MSDPKSIRQAFDSLGYVVDEELATILFLMLRLQKPLLLEGNPGVGKTETAAILAKFLDTELIRLQCYEGLDSNSALYEWNYQKQLLAIKIQEQSQASAQEKEDHIFSEEFLLTRPLLKAITAKDKPVVLLIDEIDRADEEFEAFLLELLSVFQISIPELGTIRATHKPYVILTSNRTRELSDALKRRCLYHWVDYPSQERERQIVQKHLPDINERILNELVDAVRHLRELKLDKVPGVAETIDWAEGLLAMGADTLSDETIRNTLGLVLKTRSDHDRVINEEMDALVQSSSS